MEESLKELREAFLAAKISYSYNKIPTDEGAPKLPYVTANVLGGEGADADNGNYSNFMNLSLSLFTKKKDPAMEDKVMSVLNSLEIAFTWSESYVETDNIYEINYSFQMEA